MNGIKLLIGPYKQSACMWAYVTGPAIVWSACAGAVRPRRVTVVINRVDADLRTALQSRRRFQTSNQRVQQLADEQGIKVAQNVAAGVAGLFIWPLFFAMDLQGTATTEMNALQARQQYLATLAQQRCGSQGPPPARNDRHR